MTWWMRVIGALYVFLFVIAVFPKVPIRAEGPKGLLTRAAEGDPTARFVVDVWFMLGLYFAVIGIALLVGSGYPAQARALVTWLFIHTAIIVSGVLVLR